MYEPRRWSCTVSLVTYETPAQMVREVLAGLSPSVFVTIVDNSPYPALHEVVRDLPAVSYHHAGSNLGYGKGHNLALQLSPLADFHLIINPDIIMTPDVLPRMLAHLQQHPEIGLLAPKLLHTDGSIQHLNRRSPTVLDLVLRRLPRCLVTPRLQRRIRLHEMQDVGYEQECDVVSISGAFMLCRRTVLEQVGGFDPRYFMYFEDFDLCNRVRGAGFRTVYYPAVAVVHRWERASARQISMTLAHIRSMILFFNTWGWRWY